MFFLSALFAILDDTLVEGTRRAAHQEMQRRLGLAAPDRRRGDLAGRLTVALGQYQKQPDVLLDLIVFIHGLLGHGLLPRTDVQSLWPETMPEPFRSAMGHSFVNPGVYNPLGEIIENVAAQFAIKHREMRRRGFVPYPQGWSPSGGWHLTHRVWDEARQDWRTGTVWAPVSTPGARGQGPWQVLPKGIVTTPTGIVQMGTRWRSDDLNAQPDAWAVWPWEGFYEQVLQMLDWVRATHPNLAGFGFRTALAASKAWHDALPMETTPGGASRGIVVATWLDGATIERLLSAKNLADEGKAMGHCIASYDGYATSGQRLYFSYRDAQGRSRASWEMTPGEHREDDPAWFQEPDLLQLQGPRNGPIPDPQVQARIAAWALAHDLDLGVARHRFPTVSFLFPPDDPFVLPLRTVPLPTWARWEKTTSSSPEARQAQIDADDATWSAQQITQADALVGADDQAWSDVETYLEEQRFSGLFYHDEQSESERMNLMDIWPALGRLDPALASLDLHEAEAVKAALVHITHTWSFDAPIPLLATAFRSGDVRNLTHALRNQVDHLDLVTQLRDRDWFEEESEYDDYDPSTEQQRARQKEDDAAQETWHSASAFIAEFNKNLLTSFYFSETRDQRDYGSCWIHHADDEDEGGDADGGEWLTFGYGYHGQDEPAYRAGRMHDTHPFSGTKYRSPLDALWSEGLVTSRAEATKQKEEFAAKRAAFLASPEEGMRILAPVDATFGDSPRRLVEAVVQQGGVVPYALLRGF